MRSGVAVRFPSKDLITGMQTIAKYNMIVMVDIWLTRFNFKNMHGDMPLYP